MKGADHRYDIATKATLPNAGKNFSFTLDDCSITSGTNDSDKEYIVSKINGNTAMFTMNKYVRVYGDSSKANTDFDYSLVKYRGLDTKVKIICKNKHLFEQTPYKHLFCLQGCPVCNASGGEQLIISWLNSNGYKNAFCFQYFFEDCKDKNPLPFDFYIPEKNILIEYQGEQHYKQIDHFGGRKEFLLRKHHDWLKRRYARKNNLKLLAIPYWDNKEINKILEEELNGN